MRKIVKVGLIVTGALVAVTVFGHIVGPAPAPAAAAVPAPPAPTAPYVGPVAPAPAPAPIPAPVPVAPVPAPAPVAPAPVVPAPVPAPVVEAVPAPVAESWTMPNLVGSGLQAAQDEVQSLTDFGIFYVKSHDASGAERLQVSDRNWKVCTQNVAPGTTITPDTLIDLGAVKLGESC